MTLVALDTTRLPLTVERHDEKRRLPIVSLDRLLREQQTLSAVEDFSRRHDAGELDPKAKRYRELIPLERPKSNEQYAFEVDLDACTGCKACVAGCHEMNGLDPAELWRNVGMLHGGTVRAPELQTVTTSCHHCLDPACMSGCPVKAYEKDPVTGIVRHLDDQCIGCQYCTLMCPYDAPKYNAAKGIVRKCDMCSHRLANEEAPACVQACPNEAITIRVVARENVVAAADAQRFLPGVAGPEHTFPTTTYKTKRVLPTNMLPVDFYRTHPEHDHPPLVVMLTLTQASVGAFTLANLPTSTGGLPIGNAATQAAFSAVTGVVALAASVSHLGRPLYAWRAVLGLRTSWLSREALCFGLFVKMVLLSTLLQWTPVQLWLSRTLGDLRLFQPVTWAGVAFGILGVYCSIMVYVATQRQQWSGTQTGIKFFGTTLVLGATGVAMVASLELSATAAPMRALLWVVLLTMATKLLHEGSGLLTTRERRHSPLKRMAKVMLGDLLSTTALRFVLGAIGGFVLPMLLLVSEWRDTAGAGWFVAMFSILLVSELAERRLFFAAAPASRMPGGLR